MIIANSLDPDQVQDSAGPDLDPSWLTLVLFLKEFFLFFKSNIEKYLQTTKNHEKLPKMQKCYLKSCGLAYIFFRDVQYLSSVGVLRGWKD